MKLSDVFKLAKAHPWATGAVAVGSYVLLRKSTKPSATTMSVDYDSLTLPDPKPGTYGPDMSNVPVSKAPPRVGRGDGTNYNPLYWVWLSTWDESEGSEKTSRLGDLLAPSEVNVSVLASVPVVQDRILIGTPKAYGFCDGPGDARPIVKKLVSLSALALDKGVSAAAPQYSAIASFVGSILNKLPDAVARLRMKKWAEWRAGHPATAALGSYDYDVWSPWVERVQTWKYRGVWDGEGPVELSLLPNNSSAPSVEIPWEEGRRDVTGALAGNAPRVVVSTDGQIYVTLFKPDTGPPGACEARYDVTAMAVPL